MEMTFALLGISICSVWIPSIPISKKIHIPLWIIFFTCAVISGLIAGHLTYEAIFILITYIGFTYLAKYFSPSQWQRYLFEILVAIFTLLLVLHKLPGFHNYLLAPSIFISSDSTPFALYAKFDKATAGLVLLAFFCQRCHSFSEMKTVLFKTLPITLVAVFCLITLSIAFGYVRVDVKIPQITAIFLATKLLFTCVSEEAIFRGFLQERLSNLFSSARGGGLLAVFCSGLLFGLAHISAGAVYALIASIAGITYAFAYFFTKRIEASILTHFAVVAVHFFGFTYPYIR
jgi:hypothetical protein